MLAQLPLIQDPPSDLIPFLKWAGGKRWFAERHLHLLPTEYERYLEPFLGSGAVFFSLRPGEGTLSDLNPDLIETYRAVRDSPDEIARLLGRHQQYHCKDYYYRTRSVKPLGKSELAAWFIYLNRTCWNGLYRVNLKNEFNVPLGTKTQVVMPTDNFEAIAKALSRITLETRDFEGLLDEARAGDFAFVDPPYTVKHNMNGFLKYNDRIFSWADQVRLRDAVVRASTRGVKVMVTNANHQSLRDLYGGVGEHRVLTRSSVLAADTSFRARVEELVVRTWLS
jgi:DNA adenine methylase